MENKHIALQNSAPKCESTRRQFIQILGVSVIATVSNLGKTASATMDAASPKASGAAQTPSGLMCGLFSRPDQVQLLTATPNFSWIMNSTLSDDRQQAYQIRVAQSAANLTTVTDLLWDSRKVLSDRSVAVPYAGAGLQSNKVYAWQVRTWNKRGIVGAWSDAQAFQIGDLSAAASGEDRCTTPRYAVVQDSVAPTRVETVEPGHYFFDFGKDAFAALQLTLECPAACTVVVHMGEMLDGLRHISRTPGGSVRYYTVNVPLAAGKHTVTVPLDAKDSRQMPPTVGPVMPFRYVEIEGLPVTPEPQACIQRATHYPFDDHDAAFTASDASLVRVWDLCRYTMKATSFCGVFVDGDRERHPYEADAYINQLGWYNSTREFSLARYSHEYLIQHPTWPTEWSMHSVFMAWADYLYTGDAASMTAFYDDLKAKTLMGVRRHNGLITSAHMHADVLKAIHGVPLRNIVDWPPKDRDGYVMLPFNTVVNAFHYRALVLMQQIAAALGRTADAAQFRDAAQVTYDTFNATLFDKATGLYIDGEGATHSALHANMFPLAFGLVPEERVPAVAAFVRGRGMACSVYGAQYLLEACYASGMADYALELLTATSNKSWMHMINDVGTTITLEAWDNTDKPNEDWNHAWGAAPANIIPRLLMGIEPIEPGFRRVRLRPQPASLARAQITVPTVRGPITAAIRQDSHSFQLDATLPANMEGEVWLPSLGNTAVAPVTVHVNGQKVSSRTVGKFIVINQISSGNNLIMMQ